MRTSETGDPGAIPPGEPDETTDRVIVSEGVSKSYGETTAVDDVSMTVRSGEIFALVGPNGAGKTTLVRTMTGTVRPDSGTLTVFGTAPTGVDRARIGVLPQSFSPPERLTAHEILTYYAGLYEAASDPTDVLEDVGLDPTRSTFYEKLSGGERRRVAVAATIVNEPDLVFLDEPTTAIDPAGRRRLWDRFETLAANGTTIVLTTHDMVEAERLADRVAFLANGVVVKTGSPSRLISHYGGPNRLFVETDDPPNSLLGCDVDPTDRGLIVTGIQPTEIGEVAASLHEAGVDFDALSWREPTLEDAYLSLVDDGASAGEGGR